MKSFREYIKNNNSMFPIVLEGQGSSGNLNARITQPMANLLSVIPGNGLRARALDWLITQGLWAASHGREKLCKIVNEQLGKDVIKMQPPTKNIQPNQKVAGAGVFESHDKKYMALNARQFPGRDDDEIMIAPSDLFSKKARMRMPELANLKIDGMTIDEYYDKNFEPKTMTLDDREGETVSLNIDQMNAQLEQYGMEKFKFGGVDGYIEYMERGDYLPEEQKRSYTDPNDKHGPDLRPDNEGFDDNGNHVFNFVGGSGRPSHKDNIKSLETVIARMISKFGRIADRVSKGDNHGISPEQAEMYKKIIANADRSEKISGSGKGKHARDFGLPLQGTVTNSGSVEFWNPSEDGFDDEEIQMILDVMEKGMHMPKKVTKKSWENPSAFGPEWNGPQDGPEPDGWYRFDKDSLIFKLNQAQREETLAKVKETFDKTGILRIRPSWQDIPSVNAAGPVGRGSRFELAPMFNAGAELNPEKLKVSLYKMKQLDPSKFISQQGSSKVEVDPFDKYDTQITRLMDSGYKWALNTPKEKLDKIPNFTKRGYGILFQGASRYKVSQEIDENGKAKYFLHVPVDDPDNKKKVASYGADGDGTLLSGGMTLPRRQGVKHRNINPTGKRNYERLKSLLQKGEMGEPQPSQYGLKSIVQGAFEAKASFDRKSFPGCVEKSISNEELIAMAEDGLIAFAGDQAFQFGYITDAEFKNILKWDKQQQINNELQKPNTGLGIWAELIRAGVTDPIEQEKYVDDVVETIKNKGSWEDLKKILPPEALKAVGENAYQARKRAVKNYLMRELDLTIKYDKNSKTSSFSDFETDDGGSFDVTSSDRDKIVSQRGEYEVSNDEKKVWSPEELRSKNNIANEPVAPTQTPRVTQGATGSERIAPKPTVVQPTAPIQPTVRPSMPSKSTGLAGFVKRPAINKDAAAAAAAAAAKDDIFGETNIFKSYKQWRESR